MENFDTEEISNIIVLSDENGENADYEFIFKKKFNGWFSFAD